MKPLAGQLSAQVTNLNFAQKHISFKGQLISRDTLKGSQFQLPLIEFSGACAGCGQTPYAKLLTQLYGERMVIANATGCSSVWGASAPTTPYTVNQQGHGPAWGHSLFEDAAEYGYGILLAYQQRRRKLAELVDEALGQPLLPQLQEALQDWRQHWEDGPATLRQRDEVVKALKLSPTTPLLARISSMADLLVKKSHWIFGGDGWAYDIGFGGLDHVLAAGENINVLMLDTEVYSNTGGQASKATPLGSIAKFAFAGKRTQKKDLGRIFMSYGHIYVASIAMGADKQQMLKAFKEAETYNGPSLILAYVPCINHGLIRGMGKSQDEAKRAVEAGYWPLYRFDPRRMSAGQPPLALDYRMPNHKMKEFLSGETRYAALAGFAPEAAQRLGEELEQHCLDTYQILAKMAGSGGN
jgi:pyruvate-ferredoxin/flavodoxin oxidoreductase